MTPTAEFQSVQFNGSGPLTEAAFSSSPGFNRVSRVQSALHKRKVFEVARIWNGFLAGEISPMLMREAIQPSEAFAFDRLHTLAPTVFNEAMTRSDFLNLTTFVLDRIMLANFDTFPFVYKQIAKVNNSIRDFRAVERWVVDGGERTWQQVGELEGFNRNKVATSKYTYSVQKYEAGDQISWEAVINDDMGMFSDLAQRLALGGGRTIELFFTALVADANGPHASFYTSGNGNIIDTTNYVSTGTVNPVLTYDNLSGALAQFMNLRTAEGRPINWGGGGVSIMVGDGLLFQILKNIVNALTIMTSVAGGSRGGTGTSGIATTQLQIKNWLAGDITPVYNPELRNVVTTNLATAWWVFANANRGGRPAVEIGHLRGWDTPQLYRKASDTIRLSGGGPIEEMGDFETMSTEIKGMVVVGGTRMDPKMTLASKGTGS